MPTDIKLDPTTHDIDLSSGTVALYTENPEAVAQRVKIAILTKQNEWFANINHGVPYYQEFFTNKNNKNFVDNFMIEYIVAIEDVSRVLSYNSEITKQRVLNISVSIETSSGQIMQINVGDV